MTLDIGGSGDEDGTSGNIATTKHATVGHNNSNNNRLSTPTNQVTVLKKLTGPAGVSDEARRGAMAAIHQATHKHNNSAKSPRNSL